MKLYHQLLHLFRNKSIREILPRLLAAVLLLTVVFYAAGRYSSGKRPRDTHVAMSVFNSGSSGTMAFREFLEKSGIRTGTLLRPLMETAPHTRKAPAASAESIVIIDPERAITGGDIEALFSRAEQGASVFIFARQESLFRLLFTAGTTRGKRTAAPKTFLHRVQDTRAVSLKFPAVSFDGIRSLDFPGKFRFTVTPEKWRTIARDSHGPVALHRAVGKGHLIAVPGSLFLSNLDIRKSDNGLFGLALITQYHVKGALCFDEYHHGYSSRYTLLYFFTQEKYSAIILHTILFLLFLAVPAGIRFGQYRRTAASPEERMYYYSESMAGLLRTRRHYRGVLEMMIDNQRKLSTVKPLPESDRILKQLEAIRKRRDGKSVRKSDIRAAYSAIKGEQ